MCGSPWPSLNTLLSYGWFSVMHLLLNRECVHGDMLVILIASLVMAVWKAVIISSFTMDLAEGYGILSCMIVAFLLLVSTGT